jgi:hypothetical protein
MSKAREALCLHVYRNYTRVRKWEYGISYAYYRRTRITAIKEGEIII